MPTVVSTEETPDGFYDQGSGPVHLLVDSTGLKLCGSGKWLPLRDRHLQIIAKRGRMAWQKASGYHWRALVDADISRFKRVIGDGLRSRTDRRRATEVSITVNAMNRMLELGRPDYVRIA